MELGNTFFGNSRGEFAFPDRELVKSEEWQKLSWLVLESDEFDNEIFTMRLHYFGADKKEALLLKFIYKPTGFGISWYTSAFRDSYMNQELDQLQILNIFKKCAESIKDSDIQ